ncbi:MAG: gliding motility-associated C-terminal domain-containing protein [Bacteroidales bacterium]|nr:gliding motility-associated C-terminal domain-containing protein [Bacteroidales bacterium]MCF8386994.1 gliding motility-associated C-terminal domain-containing protein [Bacteroidales bacterium]MCF8397833.1 gliding motility-associated C-terminal domain-containing protein [Bacteroidales bacterium]
MKTISAKLVFFFFILTSPFYIYSQDIKRTNFWYFGLNAGLDFNSGQPIPVQDGKMNDHTYAGNITMSDTNGQLLFYTNGDRLWNRNHGIISNNFMTVSQQIVSFPVNDSDHLYYVFAVPYFHFPTNYYYTLYAIIDMNMNNGLGGVSQEPTIIDAAWDAAEHITAVKHRNKEDMWVITRKYTENKFASFKVTSDGLNLTPVLSDAPDPDFASLSRNGEMVVSYDKEYLICCHYGSLNDYDDWIEVCKFNDLTGSVDFLYYFKIRQGDTIFNPYGAEFSPDSRYLYLAFEVIHGNADKGCVYQYDVATIEDSASFLQSAIEVGSGVRNFGMQLASDGKIYVSSSHPDGWPYLAVIHKPWMRGDDCQYVDMGVNLDPGAPFVSLPNFVLDYLYRFDFDGTCEGDSFQFTSFFIPEPQYILWNFDDPISGNNTSNELNPVHVFSDGGEYEVSAYVVYQGGRIEETSRKVKVEYKPEPDLGQDTALCEGEEIILDADCGTHFYTWSTGAFGTKQITVSDTGWYWVKVTSTAGCFEYDSIHIAFHPKPIADTSQLVVSPTTCGGSTGAIKGLQFSGASSFSYTWTDDLGNPISNNPDIFHLPVGSYTLHVTDSNNCTTAFGPFQIYDAGDVLIEAVDFFSEHCDQQDGIIDITAVSGLSDMLFYSIDNGNTYLTNEGYFDGLPAGSYAVRVKDSSDCQDVYIYNPIVLENTPGPEIIDLLITHCSGGLNNGEIEIIAAGSSDTLYYSIDNGATFQTNNALFQNLAPGTYQCIVKDAFGCENIFVVEISDGSIIPLQAIAGADEACPGNAAYVPLLVDNFQEIAGFKVNLLYNNNLLECLGYANPDAQLEDSLEAVVYPAEGRVELSWSSQLVSLNNQSLLAELAFTSLDPGVSQVEWDGEAGSYYFHNGQGESVPANFVTGNVKVYKEVVVEISDHEEVCQGEELVLLPVVTISNGQTEFLWIYPGGDTSHNWIQHIYNIQTSEAGMYNLLVTDEYNCSAEVDVEVVVHESPLPAFYAQDTIITNEVFDLDAGAGFISYQWYSGDTNRMLTIDTSGWYGVTVESEEACFGDDSVYVLFQEIIPPEQIELYLPNAFSPNQDGLNDHFKIINSPVSISSFHLMIFNRWGQLIFETDDLNKGWDGTYNGDPVNEGVYTYRIDYSIKQQSEIGQKLFGTVAVIR